MIPILICGGDLSARDAKLGECLQSKKVLEQLNGAEESLKIDAVRQFLNHLTLKFNQEDQAALVIREAQALTDVAQNALLKSLEELPDEIHFYLTAKKREDLLETVVSRCQVIQLKSLPFELTVESEQEMQQIFKLIGQQKVGQLLKLAETWAKTGPHRKVQQFNHFLLNRSRTHPSPQRAQALRFVLECLVALDGPQNHQLAIEHMFLELAELASA